jgi:serine/threonine protein kinase
VQSDVYAYGIIMHEIVSRQHPYSEYTFMTEVEAAIISGVRPPIPKGARSLFKAQFISADIRMGASDRDLADLHPDLKALMEACWHAKPEARPSIDQVVRRLLEIAPTLAPTMPPLNLEQLDAASVRTASSSLHLQTRVLATPLVNQALCVMLSQYLLPFRCNMILSPFLSMCVLIADGRTAHRARLGGNQRQNRRKHSSHRASPLTSRPSA